MKQQKLQSVLNMRPFLNSQTQQKPEEMLNCNALTRRKSIKAGPLCDVNLMVADKVIAQHDKYHLKND